MTAWLVFLTIGLSWLGALAVWLAGDKRPRLQHTLAASFSVAAAAAAVALIPNTTADVVIAIPVGGLFGTFTFVPDGLSVFLTAVATVVGSLAVIFSIDYMKGAAQLGRYYALILLFIGAMAGLAQSGSIFLLFLFWEITALCSYALISFHNDDPKAVRGGVKALIITQLGGIGLLLGALVVRTYLGDYQISTLMAGWQSLPPNVLSLLAFGCLFAAMAKSAQAPFHTWLPDAMEAPTPVSALIHAATMVNAGVYLLARFYPVFESVAGWKTAVTTIGAITALLAALMAMVAFDLKRVLAYSTVSQLGYMVYAVGVGGVFASQLHLFSHAVFKALLFLAAGAVIHAVGTRDMRQMGGLLRQMPVTGVVFMIGAAALAGLPLLFNGFWSKELILEMGLAGGPLWAYIGMVLGAGLTAFYTLRMVWLVFMGETRSESHAHPAGTAMRVALVPLALGTLTTWLIMGNFAHWLAETLPFHHLHVETTGHFVANILSAPATYLAIAVVAAGLIAWWWRDRLDVADSLSGLAGLAEHGFGFEAINQMFVSITQRTASALQVTQTGHLNWNVVGIVTGLIVVLLVLTS